MKTTLKDTAKQLAFIAACATLAAIFAGCSVTKVNYEKTDKGDVSYRLYRNDHWLKTSGTGISGGMTKDGKFEFAAEGLERSPSEEFNRTMQTYTTAFVQLAQIVAAAYNPSASRVVSGGVESGGVVSGGVVSGGVESGGVENSSLTHSPTPNSPTLNSQLFTKITEYFVSRGGNMAKAKIYYDADGVLTMSDGTTTVECEADGQCRECGDK